MLTTSIHQSASNSQLSLFCSAWRPCSITTQYHQRSFAVSSPTLCRVVSAEISGGPHTWNYSVMRHASLKIYQISSWLNYTGGRPDMGQLHLCELQWNYNYICFYQIQLQLQAITVRSITITVTKIQLHLLLVACKNRYRIRNTIFLCYCRPALVHLLLETKHYSSVSSVNVNFTCCT